MKTQWVPLKNTVATQFLVKLSRLTAAAMKLQILDKLEQGKKTIAMLKRSHEISNDGHQQNTGRSEEEE
jgi:hypothetical protein